LLAQSALQHATFTKSNVSNTPAHDTYTKNLAANLKSPQIYIKSQNTNTKTHAPVQKSHQTISSLIILHTKTNKSYHPSNILLIKSQLFNAM